MSFAEGCVGHEMCCTETCNMVCRYMKYVVPRHTICCVVPGMKYVELGMKYDESGNIPPLAEALFRFRADGVLLFVAGGGPVFSAAQNHHRQYSNVKHTHAEHVEWPTIAIHATHEAK